MRSKRILLSMILAGALCLSLPAYGVSKEMIQLQTQVQQLQDQMSRMQQSFDERMGVMKDLVNQSVDNVNKMSVAVDSLNKAVQQANQDSAARNDQVTAQIQALHDSVDELKVRMAAVSKQLDDMKNGQQNLPAPSPQQAQAPPADVLYPNALRDYVAGRYDLAAQEFSDYVKFYPDTDLAGNSQYYLGDIAYKQGNYQGAIKAFDAVLQGFAGGSKAPAAQLKKGMALVQLGQKDAAAREFSAVISRYPKSPEAAQARLQLRTLGASNTRPRHTARDPQ